MLAIARRNLKDRYRARRLADRGQVGLYARTLVWGEVTSFLREKSWRLLLLGILPSVIGIPASMIFRNSVVERWIFVGAMGVSGLWLVAIFTILRTGIGPTLMGIEGENRTADILRDFASGSWQLVNGVKFPGMGDIDHVLIGPGGVFVVETKWSKQRWPMDGENWGYITKVFDEAVEQVTENTEAAHTRLKSALGDLPVAAVLVLWSNADSTKDFRWRFRKNVYRVRGPELKSWLFSLPKVTDDLNQIQSASTAFREFAVDRNAVDSKNRAVYKPTLDRFMLQSIIAPYFSFVCALYLLRLISIQHNLWLSIGSVVTFIGVGFGGLKVMFIRRAAQSWLAACLLSLFVLLVAEIAILTR